MRFLLPPAVSAMLMRDRQDKLVLLLDSGGSSQVRRTAAKQLADLVVKLFRATTAPRPSEDIKPDAASDSKVTLDGRGSQEDAWAEVLEVVAKLVPLLRSRSSETRQAASYALGLLASSLPAWTGEITVASSSTDPIDIVALLRSGQTRLASAGREYVARPGGKDKAQRRKAMLGSLGLGDGVGMDGGLDDVIGDEDEEMDGGVTGKGAALNGKAKAGPSVEPPKDIFEGLSARQIMMLKRKKGADMEEEANK